MNFFIEYFNSIVGALAAIGAVASIYYLIQEMREQNRVARAVSYTHLRAHET